MNEVKIPTVGQIVNYFPNGTKEIKSPFGPSPAIVLEGGDLAPSLTVFTRDDKAPAVLCWSIQHKSLLPINEEGERMSCIPYWDWPEIK